MRRAVTAALLIATSTVAHGHSWYQEKRDPLYPSHTCCGGTDCAPLKIEPGVLSAEEDGYRIRLTLEQSRRIHPQSQAPIDALIEWARVQPSEDGNYHLCIMQTSRNNPRHGVYCFFVPPNI
jgi:hypothetical protein